MTKFKRLFDFLYVQQKEQPLQKCMGRKEGDSWLFLSTDEVVEQVEKSASGLLDLGLKAGDKVAIAAYKNRPEWVIMDMACQMIGVISVPLYPTISPREYVYILEQAEVKYAFVGGGDLAEKIDEAKKDLPGFIDCFTFDKQEGRKFWEDQWSTERIDEVKALAKDIDGEKMATIIYTSGTTGNPKGVMLSHANIIHVVIESAPIVPEGSDMPVLSFLPLCHIFERAVAYAYLYRCVNIHFSGTDNLGGENGDLRSVKPHCFSTVPRLLEKVYEAIYNKGLALSGVKKKLFFWALSLTKDYAYDKKYTGFAATKRKIADKLIFSKWREALGGNVQSIVTGSAPCPASILQVFSAAGIPVREGYGLTETSPTLTLNLLEEGHAMIGAVGPTIKDVDILIDESDGDYRPQEGEILAKGPNIMLGYYKNKEETDKVFKHIDGQNWFCTGDIGKLVKNDYGITFLKITDRKKELLKTSGGKYVAPAPIENRFRASFLIEQIMVVGDKKKFVSALIVPAEPALKSWCEKEGIPWTNCAEMICSSKVIARYQREMDKYNPEFSHIEQIKKFTLLPNPWEPTKEDGSEAELTPTMKLKRRVILQKFDAEINRIYE